MWTYFGTYQLTDSWLILPELPSPLLKLTHNITTLANTSNRRHYGAWAQILPDGNDNPTVIGKYNRLYPDAVDNFIELRKYENIPYYMALHSFFYYVPNANWSIDISYCNVDIDKLTDIQIDVGYIKNIVDVINSKV